MFLVTGATGGLGRRIVQQLCDQNQPVRAFVRLTSRYAELDDRGAEIFIGDLTEPRDIVKACRGITHIISAHGSSNAQASYRANVDLIDAAKEAGVQHFTFISVLGCDRGYEDSPVFKAKRATEQYLQSSGLTYTILRPSGFASNVLSLAKQFQQTGVYLLIGDGQSRSSIVSTDDLATLAIRSSSTEAAKNQTFAVGGPEIIERQQIPALFSKLFQREPIVINPPIEAFDGVRTALGFVNPDLKRSLGTLRTLLANEFFCSPEEIERLETTFDIKMESLEQFLRRYLNL